MFDALAPYASLLKVALLVMLAVASFVGGCSHGTATQREADRAKLDKAAADLRQASAALKASADALYEVDALTRAAQDAAEKQARMSAAAIVAARKDRDTYRDRLAAIEGDLERAKRDPKCAQQLEATSCAIFR